MQMQIILPRQILQTFRILWRLACVCMCVVATTDPSNATDSLQSTYRYVLHFKVRLSIGLPMNESSNPSNIAPTSRIEYIFLRIRSLLYMIYLRCVALPSANPSNPARSYQSSGKSCRCKSSDSYKTAFRYRISESSSYLSTAMLSILR